ncbi:MAG TPA: T9SS type A sorting domain-containing protein [Chitinophagaceae bacterium]|nr:T9SS type A sorting domain-containing protein [Chitinophagaceae bacterium]
MKLAPSLLLFLILHSFSTKLEAQTYLVDSNFGVQGIARIKSNDSTNEMSFNTWAAGFSIQNDDKIISIHAPYANSIIYGPVMSHGLIRFTADGKKIDSSFGTNGYKNLIFDPLSTVSANYNAAFSTLILDDGRILVGGQKKLHHLPFTYLVSVVCFDGSGKVDSSFGNQGVFLFNTSADSTIGSYSRVIKIVQQSETRIILHCLGESSEKNILLAITPDGKIDSSYASNGLQNFAAFDLPNERQFYNGIQLHSTGEMMVHASSYDSVNWTHNYEYFVKLKTNGLIDSNFGLNGLKKIDTNTSVYNSVSDLYFNHIDIQGSKKHLSLLNSKNGNYKSLVRFKLNGDIDSSFGINGIKELPFNISIGTANSFHLESFKVLKNDYIVLTGRALDSNSTLNSMDVLTVLLKPNGIIDSSFGINGISLIDGGIHINDGGISILSRDSNSFIICGSDGLKYYEMIKFSTNSFPNSVSTINEGYFNIYPNPVSDHIYFSSRKEIKKATLFDQLGRQIIKKQINGGYGHIDVYDLVSGLYYLVLIDKDDSRTSKMIRVQ